MARTYFGYTGVYNANAITLNDGEGAGLALDVNANGKVTMATLIAGEDLTNNVLKTEERFSYAHVAAGTATTTVKSGAGFLHCLSINTKGASSNTLTVYDNTAGSGTVIAVIDTTAQVQSLFYDVTFATGLTIVSATGTGADYTVAYR